MLTPVTVINFVDAQSLRKLYFAMVHSHLSYGINVYGCATSTALEKLRIMQKKPFVQLVMQIIEPTRRPCSKN